MTKRNFGDYEPAGRILPGLIDAAMSVLCAMALFIAPPFLLCYAYHRSGGGVWYEYMTLAIAGTLAGGRLADRLLVREGR